MTKYIAFHGLMGSGKSYAARWLAAQLTSLGHRVVIDSFARPIKDLYNLAHGLEIGERPDKTPDVRKAYQEIGERGRNQVLALPSLWVDSFMGRTKYSGVDYVICDDMRRFAEIESWPKDGLIISLATEATLGDQNHTTERQVLEAQEWLGLIRRGNKAHPGFCVVNQRYDESTLKRILAIARSTNPSSAAESEIPTIKVKRLLINAKLTKPHPSDACYDAAACMPLTISPGEIAKMPLGITLEMPPGWECLVRSRSGNASRGLVVVHGVGTIDSGYRGQIHAVMINHGPEDAVISTGDRICQLAFRRVPDIRVDWVDELSEGERGDAGFGSSGK